MVKRETRFIFGWEYVLVCVKSLFSGELDTSADLFFSLDVDRWIGGIYIYASYICLSLYYFYFQKNLTDRRQHEGSKDHIVLISAVIENLALYVGLEIILGLFSLRGRGAMADKSCFLEIAKATLS